MGSTENSRTDKAIDLYRQTVSSPRHGNPTPRPWGLLEVDFEAGDLILYKKEDDARITKIATIHGRPRPGDKPIVNPETWANAVLIMSAPRLLEAARWCVDDSLDCGDQINPESGEIYDSFEQLLQAVAACYSLEQLPFLVDEDPNQPES